MAREPSVTLEQTQDYEFRIDLGNAKWPPLTGDIAPPDGGGVGPNPEQFLAIAMGQCLSSTLIFSLKKARVPVSRLRTRVRLTVGRNEKGRSRVRGIEVEIETTPLDPADCERFEQCVAIFGDFCTVSGAVREGIPTSVKVSGKPAP